MNQHQINRLVWSSMRIAGFTGMTGMAAAEGCLHALRSTRQINHIENRLALQFRDQVRRHHEDKEAQRRADNAKAPAA
jgi:hypothetical protein